jgi:hypothetical protein
MLTADRRVQHRPRDQHYADSIQAPAHDAVTGYHRAIDAILQPSESRSERPGKHGTPQLIRTGNVGKTTSMAV